jgi:hypothetical protein
MDNNKKTIHDLINNCEIKFEHNTELDKLDIFSSLIENFTTNDICILLYQLLKCNCDLSTILKRKRLEYLYIENTLEAFRKYFQDELIEFKNDMKSHTNLGMLLSDKLKQDQRFIPLFIKFNKKLLSKVPTLRNKVKIYAILSPQSRFNFIDYTLTINDIKIPLSKQQTFLLTTLILNGNEISTRHQLRFSSSSSDRAVDVSLTRLRKTLESKDLSLQIMTIRHRGYILSIPSKMIINTVAV